MLILGGSSEAAALARRIAGEPEIEATLSLAGATASPAPAPIPLRIGGFGGAVGLAAYLQSERIDAAVDATHPFASRMSMNAVAACRQAGVALVVFTRPPWPREPGDLWTEVGTVEEAADALGERPRTAFLTQGRRQLAAFARAPQHRYVVRAIDPPAEIELVPNCKLILARGPFMLANELKLMQRERIDALIAKNSGGSATYAKIEAARMLGIEVVMLRRPPAQEAETLDDLDAVMAWIASHRPPP